MNLENLLYVNLYRVHRHYGGPEEGGWWYDSGEPLASRLIFREDGESDTAYRSRAENIRDNTQEKFPTIRRFQINGGSDVVAVLENFFARSYPERPRYE